MKLAVPRGLEPPTFGLGIHGLSLSLSSTTVRHVSQVLENIDIFVFMTYHYVSLHSEQLLRKCCEWRARIAEALYGPDGPKPDAQQIAGRRHDHGYAMPWSRSAHHA